MLPLSQPVRGKDGRMISEIVVPRGTVVLGHFQASNSSKELWGEDAHTWNPLRHLTGNVDGQIRLGMYGNV